MVKISFPVHLVLWNYSFNIAILVLGTDLIRVQKPAKSNPYVEIFNTSLWLWKKGSGAKPGNVY